jgi:hypothetical protein
MVVIPYTKSIHGSWDDLPIASLWFPALGLILGLQIEGMGVAGTSVSQRPQFGSRAIELRLISQNDGRAGGGRDGCKPTLGSKVGIKMRSRSRN